MVERVTTWAMVQTRFEGIHRWEGAPHDVDFLTDDHRHEFHVTVQVEQFHDNRDVEYIMLKDELDHWLNNVWQPANTSKPYELGEMSCEMIAKDILEWVQDLHGTDRRYTVEVTEDGENGALVEVDAHE